MATGTPFTSQEIFDIIDRIYMNGLETTISMYNLLSPFESRFQDKITLAPDIIFAKKATIDVSVIQNIN